MHIIWHRGIMKNCRSYKNESFRRILAMFFSAPSKQQLKGISAETLMLTVLAAVIAIHLIWFVFHRLAGKEGSKRKRQFFRMRDMHVLCIRSLYITESQTAGKVFIQSLTSETGPEII